MLCRGQINVAAIRRRQAICAFPLWGSQPRKKTAIPAIVIIIIIIIINVKIALFEKIALLLHPPDVLCSLVVT